MGSFLAKYSRIVFAVFRLVAGLMFMQHGSQFLFGWLGGMRPDGGSAPFLSVMFFAGLIEFFGGFLIAVGFLTGWAAFVASGEMAVAYWWKLAPQGLLPIQNHGDLAVLYCFSFLYIASRGGGPFSVDAVLRRGREARLGLAAD